jgi:hypothetical protein
VVGQDRVSLVEAEHAPPHVRIDTVTHIETLFNITYIALQ